MSRQLVEFVVDFRSHVFSIFEVPMLFPVFVSCALLHLRCLLFSFDCIVRKSDALDTQCRNNWRSLHKASEMEIHCCRWRRMYNSQLHRLIRRWTRELQTGRVLCIRLTIHPKSGRTTNLAFSLCLAQHILARPCTNSSCWLRTSHHVRPVLNPETKHEVL